MSAFNGSESESKDPQFPTRFWGFLHFWTPVPPPEVPHKADQKELLSKDLSKLTDAQRETLQRTWERDLDEVNRDLESTRGAASRLFLAVGLISGLVSLVAASVAGLTKLDAGFGVRIVIATVLIGCASALLYFAFGTAFLAYRTQSVVFWGSPQVELVTAASKNHDYSADYLTALYIAARNNHERLRGPVGYLREAQRYLAVALALLALLVLFSLLLAGYEGLQKPTLTDAPAVPARVHGTPSP